MNIQLRAILICTLIPFIAPCNNLPSLRGKIPVTYDVIIYGGSSACVTAAKQAARCGKHALLTSQYQHVGGLTSAGLGGTDIDNYKAVGWLGS